MGLEVWAKEVRQSVSAINLKWLIARWKKHITGMGRRIEAIEYRTINERCGTLPLLHRRGTRGWGGGEWGWKIYATFPTFPVSKVREKGKSTFFKAWNDVFPLKVAKRFDRIETCLIFKSELFEKKITSESTRIQKTALPHRLDASRFARFRAVIGDLLT